MTWLRRARAARQGRVEKESGGGGEGLSLESPPRPLQNSPTPPKDFRLVRRLCGWSSFRREAGIFEGHCNVVVKWYQSNTIQSFIRGRDCPGRMFMPFCRYPAVAQQKKVTCQLVILPYADMYFIFCTNAFLSRYRCILRGIAQGDVAGHDIVFRMPDSRLDVLGFLSHWDAGYAQ